MNDRREMLSRSAAFAAWLAACGLLPAVARGQAASAYNAAAFEAKNIPDLMKALGAGAPVESKEVVITGPDIAENGAVVPIGVSATATGLKRILILVEKNPAVLAATFDVTAAVEPSFSTRVKMGQSSNVIALAMLDDGRTLFSQKEVKVTLGGCGG